jgi:hypothetical protein
MGSIRNDQHVTITEKIKHSKQDVDCSKLFKIIQKFIVLSKIILNTVG